MTAVVDFHGHIYPQYDTDRLLTSMVENSRRRFPDVQAPSVICLAERTGQRWFKDTVAKGIHKMDCGWSCKPCADKLSMRLEKEDHVVFVVSGRQIVSAERLEVLALASDLVLDDGLPIAIIIERIKENGGLPVLPWSPGKWMGKRGKVVERVLAEGGPTEIFVGDTSMRPALYSGGKVFSSSKRDGFAHLPGSDPLPLSGEEKRVGVFSACIEIPCIQPAVEIRDSIRSGQFPKFPSSKAGVISVCSRLIRLRLAK
jgi:hypothetical protein